MAKFERNQSFTSCARVSDNLHIASSKGGKGPSERETDLPVCRDEVQFLPGEKAGKGRGVQKEGRRRTRGSRQSVSAPRASTSSLEPGQTRGGLFV